ncbi:hypothetical protein NMY22_g8023 [Coprinellus aureogranulatus]|nr:hypothetical protein NMY22_g8023 [Coprinellus aureogranulatus]
MPPQNTPEYHIEVAYRKIPEHLRYQLKMDAGILRKKTLADLTFEDKDFKLRNANTPTMTAAARNAMKRNRTSPGEQPEPSAFSPPDRKRQRRSPGDTAGPTASTPMSYPSTQTMSAIPTKSDARSSPRVSSATTSNNRRSHDDAIEYGYQRPPSGQPMMGGMQGQMKPQGQMGLGQTGPSLGSSMGTMGGSSTGSTSSGSRSSSSDSLARNSTDSASTDPTKNGKSGQDEAPGTASDPGSALPQLPWCRPQTSAAHHSEHILPPSHHSHHYDHERISYSSYSSHSYPNSSAPSAYLHSPGDVYMRPPVPVLGSNDIVVQSRSVL